MVGEASGRMQKADCRDEIALPAAMLAWLKYRKQRTRNSRKRFLVFFCSLFVKARVVYRLLHHFTRNNSLYITQKAGLPTAAPAFFFRITDVYISGTSIPTVWSSAPLLWTRMNRFSFPLRFCTSEPVRSISSSLFSP